MAKYSKTLKKVKARTNHICDKCGEEIGSGDFYYREDAGDRFLQTLHAKKYCEKCYEKEGENLLGR